MASFLLLRYNNVNIVRPLKHEWFREYYNLEREGLTGSMEFINFVAKNQYWLPDYALFCVLKEKYASPIF